MLLSLMFEQPYVFLPLILALLVALTFHEVSHGIVAYWLGDNTAKDAGRLSFNPASHLDFWGTILLLTVGFGWGKPVPVNYYNLKYPKWGPAIVAAAGPLSNLLLVVVFGLISKIIAPEINPFNLYQVIFVSGNLMHIFISFMMIYNVILMVFNLIPIPPLDGSKVLFSVLPSKYDNVKFWLQTRGPFLLLFLLIADGVLGINIFGHLFNGILSFFSGFF